MRAMMNVKIMELAGTRKNVLGVTLIEIMIAAALFTLTFGAIYMVARATYVNAAFQDAEVAAQDEARRAILFMVTELRQARRSSFSMQTLPSDQLMFRLPGDADGNGLPLNVSGYLESVGTVTYTRDWQDSNGDGIGATQLVRIERDDMGTVTGVTVIANNIVPNEDVNWDGVLSAGEDLNGSRILERGIWFDTVGSLLRVTVDAQKRVGDGGRVWASVTTDIYPRN